MGTCRYYYHTDGTKSLRPSAEGNPENVRAEIQGRDNRALVEETVSLQGSEKQIAYAKDIIVEAYMAVKNLANRGFNSAGEQIDSDDNVRADVKAAKLMQDVIDAVIPGLSSAKDIIDNRGFGVSFRGVTDMGQGLSKRLRAGKDIPSVSEMAQKLYERSVGISKYSGSDKAKEPSLAKAIEQNAQMAKNGYYKSGSMVKIGSKIPSDLSDVTTITGNTYDHRAEIKAAGFKWDGGEWVKK